MPQQRIHFHLLKQLKLFTKTGSRPGRARFAEIDKRGGVPLAAAGNFFPCGPSSRQGPPVDLQQVRKHLVASDLSKPILGIRVVGLTAVENTVPVASLSGGDLLADLVRIVDGIGAQEEPCPDQGNKVLGLGSSPQELLVRQCLEPFENFRASRTPGDKAKSGNDLADFIEKLGRSG